MISKDDVKAPSDGTDGTLGTDFWFKNIKQKKREIWISWIGGKMRESQNLWTGGQTLTRIWVWKTWETRFQIGVWKEKNIIMKYFQNNCDIHVFFKSIFYGWPFLKRNTWKAVYGLVFVGVLLWHPKVVKPFYHLQIHHMKYRTDRNKHYDTYISCTSQSIVTIMGLNKML